MTFKYDNVYINDTATICGPYEKKGNLKKYFDKTYSDLYFNEKSWELAEIKLVKDAVCMLLKKCGLKKEEIDLVVGGDLLNQIVATTYGTCNVGRSFIGVYGACSNIVLGMIIASNFIDSKKINNSLVVTSSHNMTSEKQFRFPTEYGSIRPESSTFTSTGSGACLISSEKADIKVESATLGKIIDYEQSDPNDMGRVMAPAVIDTLKKHFDETGRYPNYYDLILTGDLGLSGKNIVIDYFFKEFNIDLSKNYDDCGLLLYDINKQKDVMSGASGPACCALVSFGYVFNEMKSGKYKKVLIIATGALFSPTMIHQKLNINSIAHAISLEAL